MNTDMAVSHSTNNDDSGSKAIEILARLGYLAKGVVYAVVGILAASAVFDWFGTHGATGTRGAVEAIAGQPFGSFLLILLVVGLCGYVVWRFVQAFADTEDKGSDFSGWAQRIGFMISGALYAALAFYAVRLSGWFEGSSSQNSGSKKTELTAELMQSEAGIWFVGAVGATFGCVGLYQGYRALSKKFKDNWNTQHLSETEERVATRVGQVGIGVRAVTFVIIGFLIVKAAADADPSEATGLGEALRQIGQQPFGQALLIATAFGLFCYGLYCLINSRYRAMTIST